MLPRRFLITTSVIEDKSQPSFSAKASLLCCLCFRESLKQLAQQVQVTIQDLRSFHTKKNSSQKSNLLQLQNTMADLELNFFNSDLLKDKR